MASLGRSSGWLIVASWAVFGAGCIAVSKPPVDSGLLSQQNVDKTLTLKTQAEFEQLLGPPNSTPNFGDGLGFCPFPEIAQATASQPERAVAWEEPVRYDGEIATRKLSVAFDPTTGVCCGRCYIGAPMQPSFWSRVGGRLTSGMPLKSVDVVVYPE